MKWIERCRNWGNWIGLYLFFGLCLGMVLCFFVVLACLIYCDLVLFLPPLFYAVVFLAFLDLASVVGAVRRQVKISGRTPGEVSRRIWHWISFAALLFCGSWAASSGIVLVILCPDRTKLWAVAATAAASVCAVLIAKAGGRWKTLSGICVLVLLYVVLVVVRDRVNRPDPPFLCSLLERLRAGRHFPVEDNAASLYLEAAEHCRGDATAMALEVGPGAHLEFPLELGPGKSEKLQELSSLLQERARALAHAGDFRGAFACLETALKMENALSRNSLLRSNWTSSDLGVEISGIHRVSPGLSFSPDRQAKILSQARDLIEKYDMSALELQETLRVLQGWSFLEFPSSRDITFLEYHFALEKAYTALRHKDTVSYLTTLFFPKPLLRRYGLPQDFEQAKTPGEQYRALKLHLQVVGPEIRKILADIWADTQYLGTESHLALIARWKILQGYAATLLYQQEKSAPPGKWEDMLPGYLNAVPGDPFTHAPLKFESGPDSVVIYSVGTNGKDDGGAGSFVDGGPDICLRRGRLPLNATGEQVRERLSHAREACRDGQYGRSVAAYEDVLSVKHDRSALRELAWIKATCPLDQARNGLEAIVFATMAFLPEPGEYSRVHPTSWPLYLDTMAAAYARTGLFDLAVAHEKKAITLAAGSRNYLGENQITSFAERLCLYGSRTPFIETDQKTREDYYQRIHKLQYNLYIDILESRHDPAIYRELVWIETKADPEIYRELAWIKATCPVEQFRNAPMAVSLALKAITASEAIRNAGFYPYLENQAAPGREVETESCRYWDTLAAAYAEKGLFSLAIAAQEQTIAGYTEDRSRDKRSAAGEDELLLELKNRLSLYKAQRPYRSR